MTRQFLLFIANGFFAAGSHFLILVVFIELLNFQNVSIANIISGLMAIIISYLGNRFLVFNSTERQIKDQFLKFLLTYLTIILVNTMLLSLLMILASLDYRIAFIISSAILAIVSFFVNKSFIFKL